MIFTGKAVGLFKERWNVKGLKRWGIKNGVGWNVKGTEGARSVTARLASLRRGGVSVRRKLDSEGCEFSQPLQKNAAKIGDPAKLHCKI